MALIVPYLTYDEIRAKADGVLLRHHPDLAYPVPIQKIVEFQYEIAVIPMPGLQAVHEIDAFTSKNWSSIYIDQTVMEQRSAFRYRFSLAHEIGHRELHREIQDEIDFSTIEEWKVALRRIPERERSRLESQAYDFAGLLLVPLEPFKQRITFHVKAMLRAKFDLKNLADAAKPYLCTRLGKEFSVSDRVIEKRLDRDGLWPPAIQ